MTEFQIEQVRQWSDWLAATDITVFEFVGPDGAIRLQRNDANVFTGQAAPTNASAPTHATVVRAGSVGIYLAAHPLRSEPLVQVGDEVAAGQAIALLKIGLVLLAVPAPRAGVVSRIVARNEGAVGYGDPLIELAMAPEEHHGHRLERRSR